MSAGGTSVRHSSYRARPRRSWWERRKARSTEPELAHEPRERVKDDEGDHRHRHRSGSLPAGIIILVFLLAVIILVAVAVDVRGLFTAGTEGPPSGVLVVANQTEWTNIPGSGYVSVSFDAASNGSLEGGFIVNGPLHSGSDLLLMNVSDYVSFVDSQTLYSLNSTGVTNVGEFNWSVNESGTYYLVAYNPGSNPVTVAFTTAVQFYPALQPV